MKTEHFYAVKNPENVKKLNKMVKTGKNSEKKFQVSDEKKSELTFRSFIILPKCSYDFRIHNEQFLRPQKF